jgi:hypothetical protein
MVSYSILQTGKFTTVKYISPYCAIPPIPGVLKNKSP